MASKDFHKLREDKTEEAEVPKQDCAWMSGEGGIITNKN